MKQIQTTEEVYPAIEELIAELKLGSHSKLAAILHHRMHQVAWTTRSELFEELQSVLTKALECETSLATPLRDQVHQVLTVVEKCLRNPK